MVLGYSMTRTRPPIAFGGYTRKYKPHSTLVKSCSGLAQQAVKWKRTYAAPTTIQQQAHQVCPELGLHHTTVAVRA